MTELSSTTKASQNCLALRICLHAWFSYTQEIWWGELRMPVLNMIDAVLGRRGEGGAVRLSTPSAGGTLVSGLVLRSSESHSFWKVRGVPTPHEDVWGLALCKNRHLLCGSQFILCERDLAQGWVSLTLALCKHPGWQTVCDKTLLAWKCWGRWWRQTCRWERGKRKVMDGNTKVAGYLCA